MIYKTVQFQFGSIEPNFHHVGRKQLNLREPRKGWVDEPVACASNQKIGKHSLNKKEAMRLIEWASDGRTKS